MSNDIHILVNAEMRARSKLSFGLEDDVAIRITESARKVTKLVVPRTVFVI